MDLDSFRPLLSGLVGATIAAALTAWWQPYLARGYRGTSLDVLKQRYRSGIRVANVVAWIIILGTLAAYLSGAVSRNDWRGAAAGFGGAVCAATLIMYLFGVQRSGDGREGVLTYIYWQQMPRWLYGIMLVAAAFAFFASVYGFVTRGIAI